MEAIWTPSIERVNQTELKKFMSWLNVKKSKSFKSYEELYTFSTTQNIEFWTYCIEYFEVIYEGSLDCVESEIKFLDYDWFPKVQLNFAENLLMKGDPDKIAIHFIHESSLERIISYKELLREVERLTLYLEEDFSQGDVLAAYMPNIPETITAMLACTSLGGVFTSTSCDFGVSGVVDRFEQSKPKVLIAASHYSYNGKIFDQMPKIKEIVKSVSSIKKVIIVDFLSIGAELPSEYSLYSDIQKINLPHEYQLRFVKRKFSDPLYIMYSSGTTGKPKCIVHSIGGTLIQHMKELNFHTDVTKNTGILFFTTCGWMMWNWLVSALSFGARVGLFEGSPAMPTLVDFVQKVNDAEFEVWGTSPKFLRALELSGYSKDFKFESLKTILSTGAPLLPEQFDFVYHHIKSDVQLSSISGGTDIIGCFMLGNPMAPVFRGEIQARGLGLNVESLDENQKPVRDREGELVCLKSFPSQPIYFLGDEDGQRYKSAYFETYGEKIWHHGDFITITGRDSVIVHGRSDATLNPGGVRIGTAEIYRQVELIPRIDDSLCVGLTEDGDVSIVLFITFKNTDEELTEEFISEIKKVIKSKTTPRHVPKYIKKVSAIPYTRSGKKMELAVTRILAGKKLTNIEAVGNPECLGEYEKAFI